MRVNKYKQGIKGSKENPTVLTKKQRQNKEKEEHMNKQIDQKEGKERKKK